MLSSHTNIMWEIVRDNPDKPWDFDVLSNNPNITWEIVRDNLDRSWNFYKFSEHPNITWKIVRDNPDRPWNYSQLSKNLNITWEIIRNNPNKNWNYFIFVSMYHNKNIIKIADDIRYFREVVKEELMSVVWHPSRVDKWKYLDDDYKDL